MDDNNIKPISDTSTSETTPAEDFVEFKKPIYVGKIGKIPKKIYNDKTITKQPNEVKDQQKSEKSENKQKVSIPYKEPLWSGLPPSGSGYKLEVLKSGVILDTIDITTGPYHVFGRYQVDIMMAHPTVSRCHAVIQYKAQEISNDDHPIGWYLYDLNSSHGTFLNKNRIKPQQYVRVKVGHLIRFGCSTRQFLLQGPEDDTEEESELSLTEMKQLRLAKKMEIEKEMKLAKLQKEQKEKKEEDTGIDWGMGDDAEEETDLADNPFATTTNEELYLDDPKKTLRGFFEREGVPLEYKCEEKGIGQFLCRVELPIEDMTGRSIIAEVLHKGKKKDAVVQCALEACRIIDRHGMLRQAKHESRKRKEKDWQEIDFYDSDEDTFLDRTGAIEKKRNERIKKYKGDKDTQNANQDDKAFTYDELITKCELLQKNIDLLNQKLETLRNQGKKQELEEGDEDELDKFMKGLNKQSVKDKAEISKTKMEIQNIKQELAKTQRLAEIAKPANIPALIKATNIPETSKPTILKKASSSVIIGKRIKLKNRIQTPYKYPTTTDTSTKSYSDEEIDSDEDETNKKTDLNCSGIEEISDISPKKINEKLLHVNEQDHKNVQKVKDDIQTEKFNKNVIVGKNYGPMRPPEGYVIPQGYFDQPTDRDLPEEEEEENKY